MLVSHQADATAVPQKTGPRVRMKRMLLGSAMELMQRGIVPSVSDVAEAAEVSRATAYRYFPHQASMIQAAVGEALGPILAWSSQSPDPQVRVADLAETRIDPFARALRHNLRRKYDFDFTKPVGVHAVYSEEPPIAPHVLAYDDGAFRCVCPGGENGMNDCEHKNRVEGSIAFVPSVFGMTMASVAVKLLAGVIAPRAGIVPEHLHS